MDIKGGLGCIKDLSPFPCLVITATAGRACTALSPHHRPDRVGAPGWGWCIIVYSEPYGNLEKKALIVCIY